MVCCNIFVVFYVNISEEVARYQQCITIQAYTFSEVTSVKNIHLTNARFNNSYLVRKYQLE
jgi:hypothetical protein